ncbi:MAG TPA: glycosyltransferase family 2 protein [Pyrinomonadaceae bacterium]|nr:glycosyltransferase family 2 protein [Pyrinomonadaceae bacterium]
MPIYYAIAALILWQGIASLRGGLRYLALFRRELNARPSAEDYAPFAAVFVPCRGSDQGLRENFEALFAQDYPAFELVFVSDRGDDPALALAEEVGRGHAGGAVSRVSFLAAGRATESGQKVHNLLAAVRRAGPRSRVFVFVDTDARPQSDWLSSLVAPLADEGVGAATGYRWFVPERGGLASHLRAVWNASIASALGENGARNFCWGGSTAIRRETFERLSMAEHWRGTLSDDFALTRALHAERLPIKFVPACLTPSVEDCTAGALFEFTTRQLKITRVYAPQLWLVVLFSNLLFVAAFWGGLALAAARAAAGREFVGPLAVVATIFLLGAAKSLVRWRAVALALAPYRERLRRGLWAHLTLWPLTAVLFLFNALAALVSRRIEWRGIRYELKSATQTIIVGDDGRGGSGRAERRAKVGLPKSGSV